MLIANVCKSDSEIDSCYTSLLLELNRLSGLSENHIESLVKSKFAVLDYSRKLAAIERMQLMVDGMNNVHYLNRSPNQLFLRSCLKKFGWKVSSKILNSIGDSDTVEIYGTDFTLKVANMRFIQISSYSLEEVLLHEFHELFAREQSISAHLIRCAEEICNGSIETIFDLGPDHLVEEKFSIRRKKIWVQSRFVTAVYTKWNTVSGFLYSASAEVIEHPKSDC